MENRHVFSLVAVGLSLASACGDHRRLFPARQADATWERCRYEWSFGRFPGVHK